MCVYREFLSRSTSSLNEESSESDRSPSELFYELSYLIFSDLTVWILHFESTLKQGEEIYRRHHRASTPVKKVPAKKGGGGGCCSGGADTEEKELEAIEMRRVSDLETELHPTNHVVLSIKNSDSKGIDRGKDSSLLSFFGSLFGSLVRSFARSLARSASLFYCRFLVSH